MRATHVVCSLLACVWIGCWNIGLEGIASSMECKYHRPHLHDTGGPLLVWLVLHRHRGEHA